jgi:hypothetical protein
MTDDDQLAENVLAYVNEGLSRLVHQPGARPHLEAWLRGEIAIAVSRAECGFALPGDLRTDLGGSN